MADKTSTASYLNPIAAGNVTTSGTVDDGSVEIKWDDADTKAVIMESFERARVQMMNYLNRRLT